MRWQSIPGFSRYRVSDTGVVERAVAVGPWLPGACSQWVSNKGYVMVDMTNDQGVYKSVSVHRCVALSFLGSAPVGATHVRHLDGDKKNNRLENLSFGTPKQNEQDKRRHGTAPFGERNWNAKLTNQSASEADKMLRAGLKPTEIGRRFGVTAACIKDLQGGRSWTHVTGRGKQTEAVC